MQINLQLVEVKMEIKVMYKNKFKKLFNTLWDTWLWWKECVHAQPWYGISCDSTVSEHTPVPIKGLLTRSAPLHSVHPGRPAHHQQLLLPQQVVPVSSQPVLSDVPDVLWEGNVSSGSSPAYPAAPLWSYGGIHIQTINWFRVKTTYRSCVWVNTTIHF
jgi:hypothetical protein